MYSDVCRFQVAVDDFLEAEVILSSEDLVDDLFGLCIREDASLVY